MGLHLRGIYLHSPLLPRTVLFSWLVGAIRECNNNFVCILKKDLRKPDLVYRVFVERIFSVYIAIACATAGIIGTLVEMS